MTRECKRDGCTNARRDIRGSAGLFCSDECRLEDSRNLDTPDVSGIARDIANGGNNED